MKLESRYDLGQLVWGIGQRSEQKHLPCAFCNGTGIIKGANDVERTCPDCYGEGTRTEWEPQKWLVDKEEMTVGRVGIEIVLSPGIKGEEVFDNYKAQESAKEEYMCVETGVGSGRLWGVGLLFASKAEAQVECDKRNGEEV